MRATRKAPASVPSNVVPLRPARQCPQQIAETITERRIGKERAILDQLTGATNALDQRFRSAVADLPPIGLQMDYATLLDWIEVGHSLLRQGGRA